MDIFYNVFLQLQPNFKTMAPAFATCKHIFEKEIIKSFLCISTYVLVFSLAANLNGPICKPWPELYLELTSGDSMLTC